MILENCTMEAQAIYLGHPNQETRPSIFGVEPYPSGDIQPIDWTKIPVTSPINSGQFSQSIGSFSFSTQRPHPAQFPFPSTSTRDVFNASSSTLRCKRKTDSPPLQPSKQHITEEKMVEHMSRLHINSETAATSRESATDRTRRLYMCEEMRKLQSESILPQSLLSSLQGPCTALVLWTPPQRFIPAVEDPDNGNNNELSIPDQNRTDNMEFDN